MSQLFPVVSTKSFPGMSESTGLTRSFSEQGCRLRLRKEPRTMLKPRGPAADDYQPRSYARGSRTSQTERPSPTTSPAARIGPRDHGTTQSRQASRSYSHQSQQSYEGSVHYDEPVPKRTRTGSEQNQPQSFAHQNISVEGVPYPTGGMYADTQTSTYPSLHQQPQQTYGFSYSQSPQEVPRDQYFGQTARGQLRSASYSGPSSQYTQNFAPQTQAIRSQQPAAYLINPPTRALNEFNPSSYAPRNVPQEMGMPSMSPISGVDNEWERMAAPTTFQLPLGMSSSNEPQTYEAYAGQIPSIQGGPAMGFPPMTTAPPDY